MTPKSPRDPRQLTPRAIVEELDRYIIGQEAAKRAVAIALRNRWRRQQVDGPLRDEITPKNIILIGPTGVGKTEIARRLARLTHAPFLKIEATKFTEVGYVGRDVDSIVRDLIEIGIKLVREEEQAKVKSRAREAAEDRLLDVLLPPPTRNAGGVMTRGGTPPSDLPLEDSGASSTREKLRDLLRAGRLNDREVELDVAEQGLPLPISPTPGGLDQIGQLGIDISSHIQGMLGGQRKKKRKVKIPEALEILAQEEAAKLIDMDRVQREAVTRVEQSGIVFLDELDKIAGGRTHGGPDVSREGVQRDLLPIVEGTTVNTKYGPVRTDHVLFIAAGAFHMNKPSDLIPELQGRFPIRVELTPLTQGDMVRILSEPENSLTRQYQALLHTENVRLSFHPESIAEIARIATTANQRMENIGARRLQTVLERVLDELSFEAPEVGSTSPGAERVIEITKEYVEKRVAEILEDQDLSRYIL